MDTHKFSGNDPILIIDFLTRMVEETDNLLMSEEQAYFLLTQFLTNPAPTPFRELHSGSLYSGATCCPESVQNFQQTFAAAKLYP